VIHSRPFAYSIAAFLAVVLLAGGGVFAFQARWQRHVSIAEVPQKPATISRRTAAGRIAILRSEATAQFLHTGGAYEAHPQYWKDLALHHLPWQKTTGRDSRLPAAGQRGGGHVDNRHA
jgi:hypothetical protein